MLEGEALVPTENIGFPISHLLDGENVLCGFLSWNVWKMNILWQERTWLAVMFTDKVVDLPDVLKFLGWKYIQLFQTHSLWCQMVFCIYDSSSFS